MNLVTSVAVKNFRGCAHHQTIPLTPLTFLVGPNNSGKSSITASLMLAAQSVDESVIWSAPNWTGRLVDLGSYEDTVNKHNANARITIELGVRLSAETLFRYASGRSWKQADFKISWTLKTSSRAPLGEVAEIKFTDVLSNASVQVKFLVGGIKLIVMNETVEISRQSRYHRIMTERISDNLRFFHYAVSQEISDLIRRKRSNFRGVTAGLSRLAEAISSNAIRTFLAMLQRVPSDRSGPKRWFAKSAAAEADFGGMYDDPYLNSYLPDNEIRRSRGKRQGDLLADITRDLSSLDIASHIERTELSAYHAGIKVKDNVTKVTSNLADIGFGASQVIPVLQACRNFNTSPIVIEQPEIHLHPKAQGKLAELICETALKRQVLVETHSEHMINSARIQVALGKLKSTDVSIVYVDRTGAGSNITLIGLSETGEFTSKWPDGFFDERYYDSIRLLELASKSRV